MDSDTPLSGAFEGLDRFKVHPHARDSIANSVSRRPVEARIAVFYKAVADPNCRFDAVYVAFLLDLEYNPELGVVEDNIRP